MSQKQVKKYAKVVKKNRDKIIKQFVDIVSSWSFAGRLRFAWMILTAKHKKK